MSKPSRGFTLIELAVAVAIVAIVATASMPMVTDYSINSRLREAGSLLLADTLFAQSEALKRNSNVQFVTTTTQIRVLDVQNNATLRQHDLPNKVTVTPGTITFNGAGRPSVFGSAANVDISMSGVSCSDQHRCPRLAVDGGGGVRLFANRFDLNGL